MANREPLPPVDEQMRAEAFAAASAARWETNPTIKVLLEEQAMALWARAHQARRAAMYQRGRPQ
ncbi:MAG TPA: hypothetical protein VIY51_15525 [Xanthobacteraceae bacterium]